MRRRDWADDEADRLYEMIRDGEDDQKVTDAIALALRKAAGVETPPRIEGMRKVWGKKVSAVK